MRLQPVVPARQRGIKGPPASEAGSWGSRSRLKSPHYQPQPGNQAVTILALRNVSLSVRFSKCAPRLAGLLSFLFRELNAIFG